MDLGRDVARESACLESAIEDLEVWLSSRWPTQNPLLESWGLLLSGRVFDELT